MIKNKLLTLTLLFGCMNAGGFVAVVSGIETGFSIAVESADALVATVIMKQIIPGIDQGLLLSGLAGFIVNRNFIKLKSLYESYEPNHLKGSDFIQIAAILGVAQIEGYVKSNLQENQNLQSKYLIFRTLSSGVQLALGIGIELAQLYSAFGIGSLVAQIVT